MAILTHEDLRVKYDADAGKVRAVDRGTFSVPHGKVVGLVGESGCGKTTLARAVIGGLLFATPTTLLVVPYLFAMLRRKNDGKTHHGVFDEVLE